MLLTPLVGPEDRKTTDAGVRVSELRHTRLYR
jgi:hypothetical protein